MSKILMMTEDVQNLINLIQQGVFPSVPFGQVQQVLQQAQSRGEIYKEQPLEEAPPAPKSEPKPRRARNKAQEALRPIEVKDDCGDSGCPADIEKAHSDALQAAKDNAKSEVPF